MAEAESRAGEISLLALGTTLLRNRWLIAGFMFAGAVIAGLTVITKRPLYTASASFVPQGQSDSRSSWVGLAGQFGVTLPAGNPSVSPEFYSMLLESRAVLREIADDTLIVPEMGGRRVSVHELFEIEGGPPHHREEQAVSALRGIITTWVVRTTGVVNLHIKTEWPSVSLAIARALVNGVEEANRRTRQGQAADERRFVEGRLALASSNLRAAEDRLESFLRSNRNVGTSPELTFQRDRLQRDVSFQQQLFSSLSQAQEEVRIREVRDTPVITVIEAPEVSMNPEGRGLRLRGLLGLGIGGFLGVVVALVTAVVAHGRREGNLETEEFLGTLGEIKREILRPLRLLPRGRRATAR